MRLLVTPVPSAGHLGTVVPLLRAARDHGHRVRVVVPEVDVGQVGAHGFELVTIPPPSDELAAEVASLPSPDEAVPQLLGG